MMITAKVLYYDPIYDVEQFELGDHVLQFGGQGDDYCYAHDSFDCADELTDEEWDAIRRAI